MTDFGLGTTIDKDGSRYSLGAVERATAVDGAVFNMMVVKAKFFGEEERRGSEAECRLGGMGGRE